MMKKMATTCRVLNSVLRDDQKYDELKKNMMNLKKWKNVQNERLV